jgi:hypothetical protein
LTITHFPVHSAGARARDRTRRPRALHPEGQGQDAARRDFVLNQRGAEDLLSPSSVMRSATGWPIYPGCPVMGSGSQTVQRATKREFHGSLAPENHKHQEFTHEALAKVSALNFVIQSLGT